MDESAHLLIEVEDSAGQVWIAGGVIGREMTAKGDPERRRLWSAEEGLRVKSFKVVTRK